MDKVKDKDTGDMVPDTDQCKWWNNHDGTERDQADNLQYMYSEKDL